MALRSFQRLSSCLLPFSLHALPYLVHCLLEATVKARTRDILNGADSCTEPQLCGSSLERSTVMYRPWRVEKKGCFQLWWHIAERKTTPDKLKGFEAHLFLTSPLSSHLYSFALGPHRLQIPSRIPISRRMHFVSTAGTPSIVICNCLVCWIFLFSPGPTRNFGKACESLAYIFFARVYSLSKYPPNIFRKNGKHTQADRRVLQRDGFLYLWPRRQ